MKKRHNTDKRNRPALVSATSEQQPADISETTEPTVTLVEERLPKLAASKVTRAMRAIRNCGSLSRYHPTTTQSEAIVSAMKKEIDTLTSRLVAGTSRSVEFQLPAE